MPGTRFYFIWPNAYARLQYPTTDTSGLRVTPGPFGACVLFGAHLFGVEHAEIGKLWHSVMGIFPCYATGLVAMRYLFVGPSMIAFVGYGHKKSEICGNI